jgi:hypothetical protein
MVEHTAHNGSAVGSIPSRPIIFLVVPKVRFGLILSKSQP